MTHQTTEPEQHVISIKTYLMVFAALLVLLIVTVGVARFDFGLLNIVLALSIALAKALLIMLYFMHVRYSSRLTWVFAGAGFLWLAILLGLTMCDYIGRTWVEGPAA